ncbi:uncharacterized protein DS421_16g541960 [Arachis hypogaea]|nr:uncharacterized protein DS421_16g541960 [Arachis hypogaea]
MRWKEEGRLLVMQNTGNPTKARHWRRGWEEEMAENKEAWKSAVESEAISYSDEEDIMAILQEQNEAISMKRRQSKRKEKFRRSRPKCQKQICHLG